MAAVNAAFEDPAIGTTHAVVVHQGGRRVAERYAPGIDAHTTLPFWSLAKSVLHLAIGVLVGEVRLSLQSPTPIPGARVEDLLAMRAGLLWREQYEDDKPSDVREMLWGEGRPDMAAFMRRRLGQTSPPESVARRS